MRSDERALLIVAHGSTVHPDSTAPTLAHAAVIPRELELSGRITKRSNGQIWKYCEPVGNHSMMTELLLKRAGEIAQDVSPAQTTLLIVAHGTDLNENSAAAAKREAEKIRSLGKYAAVLNVYMEEPPLVSDWRKLTKTRNVVVVPFFISDGLHSYEDIPALLGIANQLSARLRSAGRHTARQANSSHAARGEIFRHNPYAIDNRSLSYAPSIGTDPGVADIIIEQAANFDAES